MNRTLMFDEQTLTEEKLDELPEEITVEINKKEIVVTQKQEYSDSYLELGFDQLTNKVLVLRNINGTAQFNKCTGEIDIYDSCVRVTCEYCTSSITMVRCTGNLSISRTQAGYVILRNCGFDHSVALRHTNVHTLGIQDSSIGRLDITDESQIEYLKLNGTIIRTTLSMRKDYSNVGPTVKHTVLSKSIITRMHLSAEQKTLNLEYASQSLLPSLTNTNNEVEYGWKLCDDCDGNSMLLRVEIPIKAKRMQIQLGSKVCDEFKVINMWKLQPDCYSSMGDKYTEHTTETAAFPTLYKLKEHNLKDTSIPWAYYVGETYTEKNFAYDYSDRCVVGLHYYTDLDELFISEPSLNAIKIRTEVYDYLRSMKGDK